MALAVAVAAAALIIMTRLAPAAAAPLPVILSICMAVPAGSTTAVLPAVRVVAASTAAVAAALVPHRGPAHRRLIIWVTAMISALTKVVQCKGWHPSQLQQPLSPSSMQQIMYCMILARSY